jgi:hypothetical protein
MPRPTVIASWSPPSRCSPSTAESDADATAGLFLLTEELADHIADKLAISSSLFGGSDWSGAARNASLEFHAVIERVLRRAQDAGGVRQDIGTEERHFLIRGLAQPLSSGPGPDSTRDGPSGLSSTVSAGITCPQHAKGSPVSDPPVVGMAA